jgi:hypothetical protein
MKNYLLSTLLGVASLFVASCGNVFDSATPSEIKARENKAKGVKPPPEPVSGQSAFFRMYAQAKTWAPNVQGLRCEPVRLPQIPDKDGKFPAWRCSFVSQEAKVMKTFSYSAIQAEGLYEGVFAGHDESYAGPRGRNLPFPILALKIDTDAAIKTAMEKSKDYMKKNPGALITPVLEKTKEDPNPVWRVYWGNTIAQSNYSVVVDASTGAYQRTMH